MPNNLTGHCGILAPTVWHIIAAVVLLASSPGCALFQGIDNYLAYNDATNDFVMGWRNSVWARQAWYERKSQFVGQPYFSHFGAGFRAGYENVASGGNGCPPGIAPREFWSWKYQTPEGQGQVAAWFSGFPYGAKAAEEDGAGLYQQIQVSHAIERQYSPEFQYSLGTPDAPPIVAPAAPVEPVPAPLPQVQDPAPVLNPQTRVAPPAPTHVPSWPPMPGAGFMSPSIPGETIMPAAYHETAAGASSNPFPSPTTNFAPVASSSMSPSVGPWAPSR
ncbi:MAG: hypothetical protein AB7F89_07830 [Pirellulaceae bacterium]